MSSFRWRSYLPNAPRSPVHLLTRTVPPTLVRRASISAEVEITDASPALSESAAGEATATESSGPELPSVGRAKLT